MTALAVDRLTPKRQNHQFSFPVEASSKIYAGSITCLNASGNAVKGSTSTTLKCVGVAIEQGLFAILALFWMWVLFALAIWRKAAGGKLQPWLIAATLSLVTILVHGLVEDAFYGSRALMLLLGTA